MYCKNCGNELKDSDRFCDQCGSSVDNEKKRGNFKLVLIIVLLVLCVVGAGGIAFFALKNDSKPKTDEIKRADNTNLTEDAKTGDTDDSDNTEDINNIEDIDDASYLAWVKDDSGRYGYVSKTGEEIVPCRYDRARDFENGFARVGIENGVDEDGKTLYRYGYVNAKGEEVVPCRYDSADDFKYGFAKVGIENGVDEDGKTIYRYGYVNTKGEEVVPCIYDYVGILEESKLIKVEKDDTAWLLDMDGKEILPDKFEYIGEELGKTGLIHITNLNGKHGCINCQGEEVVPAIYDYITYVEKKNLICVRIGSILTGQHGLLDIRGREIVSLQDAYMSYYEIAKLDLLRIQRDGKYGYVDCEGNVVIPTIYDQASEYRRNGLAIVNKDHNTFLIDKTGAIKCKCKNTYAGAMEFDGSGLAVVLSEDGGWGAINEDGEEVIPCIYDYMQSEYSLDSGTYYFYNNYLAAVEKNDKYGVVNKFGEEIIPVQYDWVRIYDNGIIYVEKDEICGAMNSKGDLVLPFEYDSIISARKHEVYGEFYEIRNFGSTIIASKNLKTGLFNETGNEIFPCIYESFDEADEKGYFVAYLEEDQKSPVLLTIEGKEIVPKGYDYIGVTGEYDSDALFPAFGDDDLIPVSKQGQCSYLDRSGNEIMQLSNKYTRAGKFVRIP